MPITRRQVALGLAWAVPTIAVASAAPAIAASGCPTFTLNPGIDGSGYDVWTLINSGPFPWPAGTTLTWTLQNALDETETFSIVDATGLTPASGSLTLDPAAQGSFTFTTIASVASGDSVSITLSTATTLYTYNGQFTMTWPAPYDTCPAAKLCGSNVFLPFGFLCPGGGTTPLRSSARSGKPPRRAATR